MPDKVLKVLCRCLRRFQAIEKIREGGEIYYLPQRGAGYVTVEVD